MQVYSFVKLAELYYAGSHGMDIKGPAKGSKNKKVSEVKISLLFVSPKKKKLIWFLIVFFSFHLYYPQGNGVLFQPASEFLPMIDEVCFLYWTYIHWMNTNHKIIFKLIFKHEFSGLQTTGGENEINSRG